MNIFNRKIMEYDMTQWVGVT